MSYSFYSKSFRTNYSRSYVSDVVFQAFPDVARRLQNCVQILKERYNLPNNFGLFWNFCINAPRAPATSVKCSPHVDSKSGALLVCAVFVYYYGGCKF